MAPSFELYRRYLVKYLPDLTSYPYDEVKIGYLCLGYGEDVKIIEEKTASSTSYRLVKTKGYESHEKRREVSLTKEKFKQLWSLVDGLTVEKKRITFSTAPRVVIDIYLGNHVDLFICHIEFKTIEEAKNFKPYDWLDRDITDDLLYRDSSLCFS